MKKICLFIAFLAMVLSMSAAKKVTWVIDAGHGGRDYGCEGRLTREKDVTLAIAKEVGKLVKKNISGVRVVYTREKDKYLSLQERCNIANARGAALFISIHVNSAPTQFPHGTETFFATNVPLKGTQAGKSELLALLLQRQYLAHGREISRGVKKRELYVCEHTNMPSVLTEVGFMSNLNEEAYLKSKDGQKELAQAIQEALAEWKELTQSGSVSQKDLRNLRVTHYAPKYLSCAAAAAMKSKTKAQETAPTPAKKTEKEEAKAPVKTPEKETAIVAEKEAEEKPEIVPTVQPEEPAEKPAQKATATTQPAGKQAETGKPYFAIQLMNTSARLKEGDYRLKGYKPVTQLPAGERFKIIYGHSTSYKDIKNELAQVRETFPEAFIVAFLGDKQITTAEAINLLQGKP